MHFCPEESCQARCASFPHGKIDAQGMNSFSNAAPPGTHPQQRVEENARGMSYSASRSRLAEAKLRALIVS